MTLFSYELAQIDTKLLAASVYYASMMKLEQDILSLLKDKRLSRLSQLLSISEKKVVETSNKVL